jgi:hypothetical protein
VLGANTTALMRVQVEVLFWDFVAPIPSRLILIACRYAQPAIITRAIELVSAANRSDQQEKSAGIVFWAVLIYLGMVVNLSKEASQVHTESDNTTRSQVQLITTVSIGSS